MNSNQDSVYSLLYEDVIQVKDRDMTEDSYLHNISFIDISNNYLTKFISPSPTSMIISLNISNNNISGNIIIREHTMPLLTMLDISYNNISLVFIDNDTLDILYAVNNQIEYLELKTPRIIKVDVQNNKLKSISIDNNAFLEYLNAENNQLTDIYPLTSVGIYKYNNITQINKIGYHNSLDISYNKIKTLNIKSDVLLQLNASYNLIEHISIDCSVLSYVYLKNNYIRDINGLHLESLLVIDLRYNLLYTLLRTVVEKFTYIKEVLLKGNKTPIFDNDECPICYEKIIFKYIFTYCGHVTCKRCSTIGYNCSICRARKCTDNYYFKDDYPYLQDDYSYFQD